MKTRLKVRIKGRVQGVGYRAFVNQKANDYGLAGWVRNMENGDVEAIFEGDNEDVRLMVKACQEGPRTAKVENVQVFDQDNSGEYEEFQIL